MLREWRLCRFKSVRRPIRLDLAPLTVFAGANSSGKSTVIQSMLLTAQTLQSPVATRSVVLNGHMTRLGAFTDIVSDAEVGEEIRIGFNLALSRDEAFARAIGASRSARAARMGLADSELRVECDYSFSMRGGHTAQSLLHLQPRLEESVVSVQTAERVPGAEVHIKRSSRSVSDRAASFGLSDEPSALPDFSSLEYELIRSSGSRVRTDELVGRKNAGALVRHFLPNRTSVVFEAIETDVKRLMRMLTQPAATSWFEIDYDESVSLDPQVRTILRLSVERILQDPSIARDRQVNQYLAVLTRDVTVGEIVRAYRKLPPTLQGTVAQVFKDRETDVKHALRGGREDKWDLRVEPLPELASLAVDGINEFFSARVRYLGPLRDEPKPVYPLAGSTDPQDIGFRGEHTAAVLDTHRNTTVTYVPSAAFGENVARPQSRQATLLHAVQDWLTYMGVGISVQSSDQGKLGHELKIAVSAGSQLHDLTQVGVGVSQLLPILVLCLLARPRSLLILEQPELHLHPKVQTRLADFFVSLTQVNKQCIVETHSEYLINRLRYRAAVTAGKEFTESVILYFVEKHRGQSHYRPIRINEYGVIEDWPRGFFDEGEENAASILRAGLEKRSSQEQK